MYTKKSRNKNIIYGAGEIGNSIYGYLKRLHKEHLVYAFCDARYADIQSIDNIKGLSYEQLAVEAKEREVEFVICIESVSNDAIIDRLESKDIIKARRSG